MGGHGFAGGGHMGHGPTMAMAGRGRGFGAFRANGISFGARSGRPFSRERFHDGFRHRFRGYPWAYGFYVDPWLYGDYGDSYDYQTSNYQPSYDYAASSNDQSSLLLQDEIDRLHDEVSRLRDERDSRDSQSSQERTASQLPRKAEIHADTVLIFRDKHTQEVQNYAIVGKTIWVFNERRATKIPLADLDLPATTKANDDRGIDFKVPG